MRRIHRSCGYIAYIPQEGASLSEGKLAELVAVPLEVGLLLALEVTLRFPERDDILLSVPDAVDDWA